MQPVEVGGGACRHFQESVADGVVDQLDGADRIAGRKGAAQSRGHQRVAVHDVRVACQEGEGKPADVARTDRDGAQAGADQRHRHRVIRVGDQQGLGARQAGAGHLADDAGSIDERLAVVDAVAAAAVDDHPVAERVHVHRQDLADQYPVRHAAAGIEQRAQTGVFRLEGQQLLQPCARDEAFLPQRGVFTDGCRRRASSRAQHHEGGVDGDLQR